MWLDIARLGLGCVLLYFGAEWLVRGSAGLARALGVRPLVIGLTVVAYGTSAPELVVTLLAAIEGKSAIALGNVMGSNIANIGLILGITALISPPRVEAGLIRREAPVMAVSAALIPLFLANGVISRLEGGLLLAGAVGFTFLTVRLAGVIRSEAPALGEDIREEVKAEVSPERRSKLLALSVVA
ncbi:MAG TPA: calcium:sodium antiporter, partial [Myxococcaceae bacterium]|nr:calcium:sodium antiporter [Myxococcaceae bacterium]